MRWSWRIGQITGIGIYVHATFWLLMLLVLDESWSRGHVLATAVAGIAFVLTIFGCIVLHELGHALTARRYGIRTRDITLLPIGGLARLEKMPDDPKQELWVALAGPAVNVAIAAAVFVIAAGLGLGTGWKEFELLSGGFLAKLIGVNLWLALFNLIPAFPMDGGRVLRALLASRRGLASATQIAATVGKAIAFTFGVVGLFMNPILVFIGIFVWVAASQEARMVRLKSAAQGFYVGNARPTNFQSLVPHDPLEHAAEVMFKRVSTRLPGR